MKNTKIKGTAVIAMIAILSCAAFAGPGHGGPPPRKGHGGNDGVRLAADIVNLVDASLRLFTPAPPLTVTRTTTVIARPETVTTYATDGMVYTAGQRPVAVHPGKVVIRGDGTSYVIPGYIECTPATETIITSGGITVVNPIPAPVYYPIEPRPLPPPVLDYPPRALHPPKPVPPPLPRPPVRELPPVPPRRPLPPPKPAPVVKRDMKVEKRIEPAASKMPAFSKPVPAPRRGR